MIENIFENAVMEYGAPRTEWRPVPPKKTEEEKYTKKEVLEAIQQSMRAIPQLMEALHLAEQWVSTEASVEGLRELGMAFTEFVKDKIEEREGVGYGDNKKII